MREDEERLLGLENSPGALGQFLDEYYALRLQGFERAGNPELIRNDESQVLILVQSYDHPDGRRTQLNLGVAVTDFGPKAVSISASATNCALMTHLGPRQEMPKGQGRIKFWLRAWEADLPLLSSLTLVGYAAVGLENALELRTWDAGASEYRRRVLPP
jgi:hypothetical protein